MIIHKVVSADELEKLTALSEEPWELVKELGSNPIVHPMGHMLMGGGMRFLVRRGESPGYARLEKEVEKLREDEKRLRRDLEDHQKALSEVREDNRRLRTEAQQKGRKPR